MKRAKMLKVIEGWCGSVVVGDLKRGYFTTDDLCGKPCGPEVRDEVRCVGCRKVRVTVEQLEG